MSGARSIRAGMHVVGNDGNSVGVVHGMNGQQRVRLKQDAQGMHHSFTIQWVARVSDKVHLDRSSEDAMQGWAAEPEHVRSTRDPDPET